MFSGPIYSCTFHCIRSKEHLLGKGRLCTGYKDEEQELVENRSQRCFGKQHQVHGILDNAVPTFLLNY